MAAPLRHSRPLTYYAILTLAMVGASVYSGAALAWPAIELEAVLDNTLYESEMDMPPDQNELSNGQGIFLFAGRTGLDGGFRLRRAVVQFDLSVLPPGSEILSAEVVLYHSRAAPGSPPSLMSLHRLVQEWGEGDSDAPGPEGQGAFAEPGDATWFHNTYATELWESPGGDFLVPASAFTVVGADVGDQVWACTQGLLEDLNLWLRDSSQNFGWLLTGFEDGGMNAHRFHSRENLEVDTRPRLRLVYRTPDDLSSDSFETPSACN